MLYKQGMDVLTAGGEKVGSVKHIVMTPRTQEITDLVIERGFLLPEEKVLPLSWIAHINDNNQIILYKDKQDVEDLLPFREDTYVPADAEDATATMTPYPSTYYYYGLPGAVPFANYGGGLLTPTVPQYATATIQNIPEGTVALHIGADIISHDGQKVGSLEEVFTDDNGQNVTHILISKGIFVPSRKSIPTEWIDRVEERTVYLNIPSQMLNRLPDYDAIVT
jgi:sporulation protein YlmC with PRC-barrel domain